MKKITLVLAFCLTTFIAFAQTSLSAGDIAFVGVSTGGASDADDSFAFVLLKDIDANTTITFTDRGWNDGAGFVAPLAVGDGEFTWTASSALGAGEVVILDFSNMSPLAAAFTVLGDQLFAIQGTIANPEFIAGMHLNVLTGVSDDANWDGASTSNTTSALPDALVTGNTAIRFPVEQDNWQFSCAVGCPLTGTPEQIRAILHNPANWISDNDNVYPGTVNVNFGMPNVGGDITPPTVTCTLISPAILDQNCEFVLYDYTSDLMVSDDMDPNPVVTQSPAPGTIHSGPIEVILTATDASGNSNSCTYTIDTIDRLAPTAVCKDVMVQLDESGNAIIFASDVDAGSSDSCGIASLSVSPAIFNTSNIGANTVTLTVTDLSGNAATCTATVTVQPASPKPIITEIMYNPNSTEDDWEWIELYNPGSVDLDISGFVIDDVNSVAHTTANITSGTIPAGESIVLYNADDVTEADFLAAWGNINLIAVTNWGAMSLNNGGDTIGIWDRFASYLGDNETQANVIEQVTYETTDWPLDDGISSVYLKDLTADNTIGSNWALSTDGGATPLFEGYTSKVAGGNSGLDIGSPGTPTDNTPPVITSCPEPIEMDSKRSTELGNECGDFVTWAPPMAFDNLPGVILTSNYEPGDLFPFGATEVVYTATDATGNQAECKFVVTVNDKKAPAPICLNGLSVELDATTGLGTILATDFIGSPSDDSCGPVTYLISRVGSDVKSPSLTLSCEDEEITSVQIWAEDVNGNSDYCETYILVDKSKYMCPVTPIIDLELEMNTDKATANPGDNGNYSISITNQGPDAATGVVATILIPDGIRVLVINLLGGTATNIITANLVGPNIIIEIANLNPGQTIIYSLIVEFNSSGSTLLVGEITAANEMDSDSTPGNSVDTDGDGNVVDDPEDEDDGDGAKVDVIIPCEVSIDTQPQDVDVTVCDKEPPLNLFMVEASGSGSLSYLWEQKRSDSSSWFPLNVTGNTLEIVDNLPYNNGSMFRVTVTSDNGTPGDTTDDCSVTSDEVTLTTVSLEFKADIPVNFGVQINQGGGLPAQGMQVGDKGVYSGPGVTDDGNGLTYTFDPEVAGEGITTITYTYTNGSGCTSSATDEILVLPTLPLISISDLSQVEGTGGKTSFAFEVSLSEASTQSITMRYSTLDNLAVSPDDFEGVISETLTFSPGETSKNITINVVADSEIEEDETFFVQLSETNFELSWPLKGRAKGTIVNDDRECDLMVEITGNNNYCYNGEGVVLDAGAGFASYLWSPGGQTTQTISALTGNYTVEVSNEFGCKVISEEFTVVKNQELVCNIEQDKLATNHITADGVATVYPTGGTSDFTYLWDNGETTQTATALTYGIQGVTVTDSNGCETHCQIDIAKILYCWTNVIQNVSVLGGNDGAASVQGNGGYRPYTFKWDDGSTDAINNALSVGIHHVTITDATGATSQCSVTISGPSKDKCSDFVSSVEQDRLATNHVTEDGVATVYPKGGSGQYTFLWDNGETTQTAIKLTYGVHTVTVTDSKGCETSCQINIAKVLYCWTNLIHNVSDYGSNDGAAGVQGNGGYRPYTFKWDDGSTNAVNNALSAGIHYVVITDATGATSQCSVTISQPNEEVCDGVDNDGDGQTDEGFDQDGDGIADCFDICDKGDDHVDMDNDGIPDACDDNICIKVEKPMTACYQTAVWDQQTCSWIISGEKPLQPMTECYQTAEWNGTTCTWDIIDGQRPEMPMTECYQMAAWNTQSCSWDVIGDKPMEPMTECHQTAVWNSDNCIWDIIDGKPEMPLTLCYQTAVWSDQICGWEINGEKPLEPMTECYETATWNEATCTWDILDGQTEMPMTLCYQTAVWSDQICDWEIKGEKPLEPMTECYETATWNEVTCEWDIEGVQPEMPMTQCQETAVWNELTCTWDIIENNNDCGTGTIDQCETAFARSVDENVRSCFIDIPNVSGNRWGWTNVFPSTNGTYNMDLYAAAGQCTISNGALVGNVEVIYTDGAVEVTVSTLSGYKMTVAQLYVGTEFLPTDNNGRFTTAPGQYPYSDTVEGDFNTFTFESVNVGNPGNFYVVLHADVCPNVTVPSKTASVKLELTAYPVPFKDYINLKIESPLNMNGTLSLYNGIGQQLQDFGTYTLKQGDNDINLNTGEIPIGLYFIRMTSVYGTETLKIIRK